MRSIGCYKHDAVMRLTLEKRLQSLYLKPKTIKRSDKRTRRDGLNRDMIQTHLENRLDFTVPASLHDGFHYVKAGRFKHKATG